MAQYLLGRLLMMIPLLLGITIICFVVIQLAPGEPVNLQTNLNPSVSPEAYEKLRQQYGLDDPLPVQYITWLGNLLQLDFGTSLAPDNRPVLEKIAEALPITLAMNLIGLVLVLLLAVPIGMASARWQNSMFDRTTTLLVFIGFAAPSFWLGLMGMMYFGVHLGWLPISGLSSFGAENWPLPARVVDWAHHLVLPVTVGIIGSLAGMSRYLRTTMLEVIRQDYITTARAKGASEARVLCLHALPNALLPVITILGLSIPGLIGGSVIIESLFAIPGMGQLFYSAVMMRDYPTIMGILTIGAFLTLLGNMLADICYALADPRIRY